MNYYERALELRADMDALPMPELSGEEFACPNGAAYLSHCAHRWLEEHP